MNVKKILPKILMFLVITVVLIIIMFNLNDITEIASVLGQVKVNWLLVSIGFLLLYMIFNPLSLYFLGRTKEENIGFKNSLMVGTIEYFFNGITPFSSGGQPLQIYAYNKIGVRLHHSTGIILMNFVVFQLSLVIMCLLSLFFYPKLTNGEVHLQVMIIIGLTINIFILTLFTSMGLSKTLRRWLTALVRKILSLKLFKGRLVKYISRFEDYCDGAQKTFKVLLTQKRKFLLCVITKLISLICYYLIPFFILKALAIDVKASDAFLICAMTTFAIAMTCYIPTPGSAGGIEFAFQSLFVIVNPGISSSVATSGMLLWRLITYYLLMIISFIVYLVFEKYSTNHKINQVESFD